MTTPVSKFRRAFNAVDPLLDIVILISIVAGFIFDSLRVEYLLALILIYLIGIKGSLERNPTTVTINMENGVIRRG